MGIRSYLANLPEQSLSVRRRFVVVATCASFVLVVLLWFGTGLVGRRLSPERAAAPAPGLADTGGSELPGALPGPGEPPPLNLDQISASLLKVFAQPRTQQQP